MVGVAFRQWFGPCMSFPSLPMDDAPVPYDLKDTLAKMVDKVKALDAYAITSLRDTQASLQAVLTSMEVVSRHSACFRHVFVMFPHVFVMYVLSRRTP